MLARLTLISAMLTVLLAGCASVIDGEPVGPTDARLPISFEDAERLGGEKVARALLGNDQIRGLAADRMRILGVGRSGLYSLIFPEARGRAVVDGGLVEGLCSVRLHRVVMDRQSRGIEELDVEEGQVVLGPVSVVADDDPAFARRVRQARTDCGRWSDLRPDAWLVRTEFARDLRPVLSGLSGLRAQMDEGHVTCDRPCEQVLWVAEHSQLTGTAPCEPPADAAPGAVCLAAIFQHEWPYITDEVQMTGPAPAPDNSFRPTHVVLGGEMILVG